MSRPNPEPRRRWPVLGIRALLIALLLPGVVLLLVIDSLNDYRTLASITSEAYDSALLEPARVLESSLEFTEDGTLQLATPLYAQVMLESRAGLRKYYRIEEIDPPWQPTMKGQPPPGQTLAGMPDMPRPPVWPLRDGEPVFYDASYRADPVRAVAVLRDLHYRGQHRQVMVIVAESIGKRLAAEDAAQRQEVLRDARMLGLVALLVWLGVSWALRPLGRLRNDIRSRPQDDLTPLDASRVPGEVIPLVEAVNYHIARHRRVIDEQSEFLADASHQLRTPLAIMLTQAQYALRERDPARAQEGLRAIVEQLRSTRRLTEQLLSLAHAHQAEITPHRVFDLNELAREVVLQYLPLAHERGQDLGWVDARGEQGSWANDGQPVAPVLGSEVEIQEVLANLVHNAINYAGKGAQITVSVFPRCDDIEVVVADNGPGIETSVRERAFARFERLDDDCGRTASGSGLGLPIARAFARRNGGDIELRDGEPNAQGGYGLAAIFRIPSAQGYCDSGLPDPAEKTH